MPIQIVEVINNTTGRLHYHNEQSGYTMPPIPALDIRSSDGDSVLPKSLFRDDWVPHRRSEQFIKVWINNGPSLQISESNNQFSLIFPIDYSADVAETKVGATTNGGQYILQVDQARGTPTRVKFLNYEPNKFRGSNSGHVISRGILQSAQIIGQALVDIFI